MKTVSSCDRIKSSEAVSQPRWNPQAAWILGVNLQNGFKHSKIKQSWKYKITKCYQTNKPNLYELYLFFIFKRIHIKSFCCYMQPKGFYVFESHLSWSPDHKAAFIWLKILVKQQYSEIVLQFKGPVVSKLKFPSFFHDNWSLGAI